MKTRCSKRFSVTSRTVSFSEAGWNNTPRNGSVWRQQPLNFGVQKRSGALDAVWPSACCNSVTLLTLSSERSRNDCAVAKNSNADWISELCYIACPRTGVLKSSDDSLCNFTRGLSPTTSIGACSEDRIPALCFTACPQTGVLQSSDDTLCNFARGLSPQRRWENAAQTASRHSASLPVQEFVFCSLLHSLQLRTGTFSPLTGGGQHTACK